jgi:hypothetical protein
MTSRKEFERHRIAGDPEHGVNGAFIIPCGRVQLRVIVSDALDWVDDGLPLPAWEHVSVSLPARTPTWEEMDFVKRMFFDHEETVVQFHVPRSRHVNCHPNCLHMWRPVGVEIPLPPTETVGPLVPNM